MDDDPVCRALAAALADTPFRPRAFTSALKEIPGLRDLLESVAGFRHGVPLPLTLEDHTLAVMDRFERFFAHAPLPGGVGLPLFRSTLALHDIGKPRTFASGSTADQFRHTREIIEEIFPSLPLKRAEKDVMEALLQGDSLGQSLQGTLGTVQAGEQIRCSARSARMIPTDFLKLATILYQCDASSYLRSAGYPSDWLLPVFEPDPRRPTEFAEPMFDEVAGRLRFSPWHERIFRELEQAVQDRQ